MLNPNAERESVSVNNIHLHSMVPTLGIKEVTNFTSLTSRYYINTMLPHRHDVTTLTSRYYAYINIALLHKDHAIDALTLTGRKVTEKSLNS